MQVEEVSNPFVVVTKIESVSTPFFFHIRFTYDKGLQEVVVANWTVLNRDGNQVELADVINEKNFQKIAAEFTRIVDNHAKNYTEHLWAHSYELRGGDSDL